MLIIPALWESEVEGLFDVGDQPGQHSETLSLKKERKKKISEKEKQTKER